MKRLADLKLKLFADGADRAEMLRHYANPLISGFTTNPTLMRRAGIANYESFAHEILAAIPDRPVSFEVFSDEFQEMERQAHKIASWGEQVCVKIPVTNTRGESSLPLIMRLSQAGVRLNVTALLTVEQVCAVSAALRDSPGAYISVFAGRIADTGCNPVPIMARAVRILQVNPRLQLIWASPRELLNVFQADEIGCHVITATGDILKKLCLIGKDLTAYSLETVKMFYDDAASAGYSV
jgi:transaldolase